MAAILSYLPDELLVGALVVLYGVWAIKRHRRMGISGQGCWANVVVEVAGVGWVAAIIGITLSPVHFLRLPPSVTNVNLIPIVDIAKHATIRFALGNVLLFVPLGFLAGLRFPGRMQSVVLSGAGLSALVELGQLFNPVRGTNIDDLILNSVGTAVGAFAAVLARNALKRYCPVLLPGQNRPTAARDNCD
jgi:VanZ family protein